MLKWITESIYIPVARLTLVKKLIDLRSSMI